MSHAAFAAGLLAGAVVFLSGLEKLLGPGRAAAQAWTPAFVGEPVATATMWMVGIAEATIALTGFAALVPRAYAIAAIAALALGVTGYGLLALRNSGSCGCGPAVPSASTQRALLLRNTLLFGALGLGATLGPSLDQLRSDGAGYALTAIFAFYVAAAGVIVVRSRNAPAAA